MTGNDVQHTFWQARFLKQADDTQVGKRRRLGGLDHHGVACKQRRTDLVAHQRDRKIPRDDCAHNAERALDDQAVRVLADLRDVAPSNVLSQSGVVLDGVSEAANLEYGFADRFALLFGEHRRQLLLVHSKELDRAPQHVGSLCLRPFAPDQKRRMRDIDRLARVFRGCARRGVYSFTCSRIENFNEVAVSRVHPLATYPHLSHLLSPINPPFRVVPLTYRVITTPFGSR